MKLIVLALVFQFVISCWPKTNIVTPIISHTATCTSVWLELLTDTELALN